MYQGDEQSQLDLRLFRIWMKASKVLTDSIRKDIERYDINPEHFMILELLYNQGPHPVQISETFSIPSGSITYVVDKLEKKSLWNDVQIQQTVGHQMCSLPRKANHYLMRFFQNTWKRSPKTSLLWITARKNS